MVGCCERGSKERDDDGDPRMLKQPWSPMVGKGSGGWLVAGR